MKTSTSTPRPSRKTSASKPPAPTVLKAARASRSKSSPSKAAARKNAPPVLPSLEEVQRRAYEIYLSRQGGGDPVSDWLQAEQELMARAS